MQIPLPLCTVRSWRRGDEASLVRHANNRNVWINLRDRFPHPYTSDDAARWMAWVLAERPETNFAIAVGGDAVGGVGYEIQPDVLRMSAEIGFWLGEAYWGRGIMTEAVRAVTEHALRTHQLVRLYATVFEWNPASMRVLEKAGYTQEARLRRSAVKDGRVIDQVLYAITREP
ncbi:MAG: GNAT family N-acetyltransferase [Gemmatimonadetes bacterium]|nr:GNAT family N-acetyltransferase [Gemmatimonadota bacterium]MBI2402647.1 GNAT family N-acetyltransferase [Gemmatimonadota bacterium]